MFAFLTLLSLVEEREKIDRLAEFSSTLPRPT